MANFEIEGPNKLEGEIAVSGAKNAAMKMIAASVLIDEEVILENVPDIRDIQVIINILTENGAEISRDGHQLKINAANLSSDNPDPVLVEKMRGSIVLIGPYLSRFGRISLPKPGGCAIGTRPIDDHVNGFKQANTEVSENNGIFYFKRTQNIGSKIDLCPSVTATENMIMAQVLAKGKSVITNVAKEPQIIDLANFLNNAGAKISGAGTDEITIEGVEKLHGLRYKVMPDPFEAATFISMAITTKSDFKITGVNPSHLHPLLEVLEGIGVKFEIGDDYIRIIDASDLRATDIDSDFYPGFSTDMLPQTALVLTQAHGKSTISEKLFENRLGYLKELAKMGAKVNILDAHRAEIDGPSELHGANIESLDLRAGATLILAGLIAKGKSTICGAEIVDRGYEKIEERLQKLGAKIKRVG